MALQKRSTGHPQTTSTGHPLVKAGVVVGGVVLVTLFAMEFVSILVGFVWSVIKVALVVLVAAGVIHLVHKRIGHSRHAL
ncbi:MAG: hypothetical protein M0008_04255 [Actinomycetota bacterium]|nr:hypothetical protein [Actinomycetota bacterium]